MDSSSPSKSSNLARTSSRSKSRSSSRSSQRAVSANASPQSTTHSAWYDQLLGAQKEAVDFIVTRPGVGLFADAGSGKTYVTMGVLERLRPRRTLIVAPLTSLDITWRKRLVTLGWPIHDDIPKRPIPEGIYLMNPEALRRHITRLKKMNFDMVVWDESQNIKKRSSLNSRLARRLRNMKRRLALSGTPLDVDQIDVWAQMRFIDHTVLGEEWQDFAQAYCYRTGFMNKKWAFIPRRAERFADAIKDHVFRLPPDMMDLKSVTVIPVMCEMMGEQERIYNDMANTGVAVIRGGVKIIAPREATRDVKLSQITGGQVLDATGVPHPTGRAKELKLMHLLGRLTPPLVVFCQYLHEIEMIERVLSKRLARVVTLHGGVTGQPRTDLINNFQAGRYDAIVCQVRTGGVSIEFTASNTLVLYSMNYSFIDFYQIIKRLHRGGQDREVTVYVLQCVSSIDEEKYALVKTKRRTHDSFVQFFEHL